MCWTQRCRFEFNWTGQLYKAEPCDGTPLKLARLAMCPRLTTRRALLAELRRRFCMESLDEALLVREAKGPSRSLLERAGAIDAARPKSRPRSQVTGYDDGNAADTREEPPLDHAALLRAERRAAMDTLLIDVIRGEPSASDRRVIGGLGDRSRVAKSKGSLRPTMDPLPARELFASSRVLGALQRECMDVARRVHELMQVGPPQDQLVDRVTADRRESRADQVVP